MGQRDESYADRVGRVRWSEFEPVEGDPADIPAALIAIRSSDEDAAVAAGHTLENCLCYEDHLVGEATVEAVPFLIECLESESLAPKARRATFRLVHSIAGVAAGFLDPYHEARRLPGGDRFAPRVRLARGKATGVTGALRSLLLDALPALMRLELDRPEPPALPTEAFSTPFIARSLAASSEPARQRAIEVLRDAYHRTGGTRAARILVALFHLGAAEDIEEPRDRFGRWIWSAASPTRATALEEVLLQTSFEDCDAYTQLRIGLSFFIGLSGPLLEVSPGVQLAVAARCVQYMKSRTVVPIDRSDYASVPGLGHGVLLLAFPNGAVPDLFTQWQIDLVELFYMHCFSGQVSRANELMTLQRFGLPRLRSTANEWLVKRGRLPR